MNWGKISRIDGWLTEKEGRQLFELAKMAEYAIEIGSWKGKSSLCIAEGIQKQVICIDTFNGSPLEHEEGINTLPDFLRNTKGNDKITHFQNKSEEIAHLFPDEFYGLVFIDGAHNEEAVNKDIANYAKKVKKGGYLVVHDVYWLEQTPNKYPAVTSAFEKLVADKENWTFEGQADRSGALRRL